MSNTQEPLSNATEAEQKAKNPFKIVPNLLTELKKRLPGRKLTVTVAALAVVIIALIITLSLNVLVGGRLYSRSSEELDLRGVRISAARFDALSEKLPECYIRWDVPLSCGAVDSESEDVRVTSLTRDDIPLFNYFTKATHVDAVGCEDYDALALLRTERPELGQTASVRFEGENLLTDIEVLDLAGKRGVDVDELAAAADKLYCLKTLDVTGCGLSEKQLERLLAAFPETVIKTTMEIYGKEFSTDTEEIDLSGITIENPAEIEAALPRFRALKKVVMCGCGLSNEDMDALNKRHDDVRFVWSIWQKTYDIRTDIEGFISTDPKYLRRAGVNDELAKELKYCTDMVALDLGHTMVTDISYVSYMPKLKYLIIADTPVTDISNIGDCPELIYLEVFKCLIEDYEPLLSLKKLEDLNLCWVLPKQSPQLYEVMMQMPWLKRVRFSGTHMSEEQQQDLIDLMPECEFVFRNGLESTGDTWRYAKNYFDMRDIFDIFYMDYNGAAYYDRPAGY